MKRIFAVVTAVAALGFIGCGSHPQPPEEPAVANARVGVQFLSPKDGITKVTVTVSGATIPTPIVRDLTKESTSNYSGLLTNLPAGAELTFLAQAWGGQTVLFEGSAKATPTVNSTISVIIYLNDLHPDPFANNAPVISSLYASADTVKPGGTVSLSVSATDPDAGDTLTYSWNAGGGSFTTSTAGTNVTWKAPAADGSYTVTVTVSDSRGGVTIGAFVITVTRALSTGDVQITGWVNDAPRVTRMSLRPTDATNRDFDIVLTVSDTETPVAALTYLWEVVPTVAAGSVYSQTPACTGAITPNATTKDIRFTPSVADGTPCTLRVTVTDTLQGKNTGTLAFYVGPPAVIAPEVAPYFVGATFSGQPLAPKLGQAITFSVTFIASPPVRLEWGTSYDATATAVRDIVTGGSEITDTFTATMPAACPTAGTKVRVFAAASDAGPPTTSATYSFNLTLLDPITLLPCP